MEWKWLATLPHCMFDSWTTSLISKVSQRPLEPIIILIRSVKNWYFESEQPLDQNDSFERGFWYSTWSNLAIFTVSMSRNWCRLDSENESNGNCRRVSLALGTKRGEWAKQGRECGNSLDLAWNLRNRLETRMFECCIVNVVCVFRCGMESEVKATAKHRSWLRHGRRRSCLMTWNVSLPPSLRTPRFPPAQTPGVGSKCTGKTISCSMLALNALMTTGTTDDSSRALLQSSQSTIQLVSRVGNYTTTDKSTLFNQKRNSKSVLAQKYY